MSPPTKSWRVLIYDPHLVVREGLRCLLQSTPLHVCAAAASPNQLLRCIRRTACDVVIMELRHDGRRDLSLLDAVLRTKPGAHALIYTGEVTLPFIATLYERGALGVVTKTSNRKTLIAGAQRVAEGQQYFAPEFAERIASYSTSSSYQSNPRHRLRPRELRIFVGLAFGHSPAEIAHSLGLVKKTVQNTAAAISAKLGITREQFRDRALEYGLIAETDLPSSHRPIRALHSVHRRPSRP